MKAYGRELAGVFSATWDGASPWQNLEKMLGAHLKKGGAWLDFACGTGDLIARAHEEGFVCAGSDYSRAQLRFAREACPKATFVQGAMQSVKLPGKFDVITCLGDSIHHLQDRKQLQQFFRNVNRHLAPGGVFIFDFNTFVRRLDFENPYTGGAFTYRDPGQFVCVEFEYDEELRTSEWTTTGFVKEGKRYRKFEEQHMLRAHPIEEVEELLDGLGFRVRKYDVNTRTMRPRKNSVALHFKCWRE
jgi:SAM-dependent methyltransferase